MNNDGLHRLTQFDRGVAVESVGVWSVRTVVATVVEDVAADRERLESSGIAWFEG